MLGVFYAYPEEYKHNDCFLKTKQTFTICTKTSGNLKMSVTRRYRYVCCEMIYDFFPDVFINHFQKIHRSVLLKTTIDLLYFWDVYDVSLWEKLAITVKPCFIETRLQKGYDLQGYFLKMTRETINVLMIAVIHYFS